jgi:uncharacterized protein YbbC (DUF1343 family)
MLTQWMCRVRYADVGARFYTFISTLFYKARSWADKPVIVSTGLTPSMARVEGPPLSLIRTLWAACLFQSDMD